MNRQPKIFGIGLARTGTTSLCEAMKSLGYSAIHFPRSIMDIDAHDFSNDITVSRRYKILDVLYPNSKFILTIREMEDWLNSNRRWYEYLRANDTYDPDGQEALLHLYGRQEFHDPTWIMGWHTHVNGVIDYFQERSSDLLIMNVCGGEGWERLCPFLGRTIPNEPFPRANEFISTKPLTDQNHAVQ
jgi:hypothetical protein